MLTRNQAFLPLRRRENVMKFGVESATQSNKSWLYASSRSNIQKKREMLNLNIFPHTCMAYMVTSHCSSRSLCSPGVNKISKTTPSE